MSDSSALTAKNPLAACATPCQLHSPCWSTLSYIGLALLAALYPDPVSEAASCVAHLCLSEGLLQLHCKLSSAFANMTADAAFMAPWHS